jgi:hydrogenase maturation factor
MSLSRRERAEPADSVAEERCITCGDVALPLEVLTVDGARGLALCRDDLDRRETVEIALLPGVAPGDRLLVHAGTALGHAAPGPGAPTVDGDPADPEEATG